MEQMEMKVRELQQETLPPAPETATTTTDRAISDDVRRTVAEVLARQVRALGK
jgi:hypothetical protein